MQPRRPRGPAFSPSLLVAAVGVGRALGQQAVSGGFSASISATISAAPGDYVDPATGAINATYFALCSSHSLCEGVPDTTGDANCCPRLDGFRQECCPDDFEFRERVCAQPFDFCTGEADGRQWTTCCVDGHRCADTHVSGERMCVPEALQLIGQDCFPHCNRHYGSCDFCGVGAACCHAPHSVSRPECANTSQVLHDLAGGRVAVCVMQTSPVELHHREGMDCWRACGNEAGGCQWCGDGNVCCRQGWGENGRDPPECRGTGNYTGRRQHECVRQVEPNEVLHMGTPCWDQCGGRAGGCDWCGAGNACCREGWAGRSNIRWHRGVEYVTSGDPPECVNATGHEHPWRHECVRPTTIPAVLHAGQDCWMHCGSGNSAASRSGPCDWCGLGNLCCREGWAADNPLCAEAVGFSTPWQHECVGFPAPPATAPAPAETGSTLYEANQTQGGFLLLLSLSMTVPGSSVDVFQMRASATSIEAAVASQLGTAPEQVQVLRMVLGSRRLRRLQELPGPGNASAVSVVVEIAVGCGDVDGQVAMLVGAQALHSAQGTFNLATTLMSSLGLVHLFGVRLLGLELPTGEEADPGEVHSLYPADPLGPGESADDLAEDVGDPAMSEEASGGHIGNFTPAHPVVVDFQLQWPCGEENASHYADVQVVQALQEAIAESLGVPASQVHIGSIVWSAQLQSLIVESEVVVSSEEELRQLPYGIMGLANSFTFGPALAEQTGLDPPSGLIVRVEGSGAEDPDDLPPALGAAPAATLTATPAAVPSAVPVATPTAVPGAAQTTVPVAAPTATPGAAQTTAPGSLGAPVTLAPVPPQAAASPSPPSPPNPPPVTPSPATAVPIFTDEAGAQSRGELDVDSSFYFDVPAAEASNYGATRVVDMLEDSISSAIYTDENGNERRITVTFVGTGASSREASYARMQRYRSLSESSESIGVNYIAHCESVDEQRQAFAGAQDLGDPAAPATAAFAEHFSSQAADAGLTPIEPSAMTPGVTSAPGQAPPPPPGQQNAVPLAASASLGMFAVAGGALVLALCFFVAKRGAKKRALSPARGSESSRDVLSGSDSDELTSTARSVGVPTTPTYAAPQGKPAIPEWKMHAPRLPNLTGGAVHDYASVPTPENSMRSFALTSGSESQRTY